MIPRITMADVAREAGVSLMTVSRVLNDQDGISEATRQRIQAVVERLGYRRSNIARGLVTKRTGTLGLVVPDNSNAYFSEVARGVEHAAYAKGYNVFLCNTEENAEREKAVLMSLAEKQVDGLILCSSRLAREELGSYLGYFQAQVLVNRSLDNDTSSAVRPDDESGGRLAVEHLLQYNRRAIGMLAGPERSFSGGLRLKGYADALAAGGVTPNVGWIQHCLPMVDASRAAAIELLTRHPELNGIFCFNDLVAIGALQACLELGRRVPDDVAIVGFDDIPLASYVTPALTTIHTARYELGVRASETLLAHLDGDAPRVDIILPVKLIVRASTP
jgi:LacI family transcriptional regulator